MTTTCVPRFFPQSYSFCTRYISGSPEQVHYEFGKNIFPSQSRSSAISIETALVNSPNVGNVMSNVQSAFGVAGRSTFDITIGIGQRVYTTTVQTLVNSKSDKVSVLCYTGFRAKPEDREILFSMSPAKYSPVFLEQLLPNFVVNAALDIGPPPTHKVFDNYAWLDMQPNTR